MPNPVKEFLSTYIATPARRRTLYIIAAGSVYFAALLGVNTYLRWASEEWPKPFNFPSLLMAAAITSFALSSSVTCEIAARAAKTEDSVAAVRWMAISIVTWMTFAFLALVEWVRLVFMLRLDWTTSFGASYLSLTVSHWIGICICCGWMIRVANKIRERDVIAVAMFSHFLNAVWLVLLVVLYLTNATLGGI